MKPSIATKQRCSLFASATEDELCVSQALLDLGNLISISESHRLKFTWGCKRKRSSLDEVPSCSRAPPSLSPSVQMTQNRTEDRKAHVKSEVQAEINRTAAVPTASPDTPLSFSPSSESDDEIKHSLKKNSSKKSKKQCIAMVEQLTERRDCLIGEIENVKKYYNKLKAQNSKLNSMKQEVLKSCQRKEETQMETTRGMNKFTHNYGINILRHPQPFIPDQMNQFPFGPIRAQFYSFGLGSVSHVGPLGIPDLNLSAEEAFGVDPSQPWDVNVAIADRRARFAEARRMRRGLIKIKSMRSACGIQLPRSS